MPSYHHPSVCARGNSARGALVVAHPGHELRVHGWLEAALPRVCVLTDGSGRTERSRLDSTTKVLAAAGAAAGPVYGGMTDVELYAAVLDYDHSRFTRIVDELASMLLSEQIGCVAGDAAEGYNPAHDICRLVINAAVRLASRASGRQIVNYDFTLIAAPSRYTDESHADLIRLNLDEAAFARKLSAARNYPELQAEVDAALSGAGSVGLLEHPDLAKRSGSDLGGAGAGDFRVEGLRLVDAHGAPTPHFTGQRPFYEDYGERQVAAGYYTRVLRYREHVLPLAAALDSHVERSS
jgi:hypothetical protein